MSKSNPTLYPVLPGDNPRYRRYCKNCAYAFMDKPRADWCDECSRNPRNSDRWSPR